MRKLWKLLQQPHPAHDELLIYLRTIGLISLCVFLIIWLLTPFEAEIRYGHSVLYIASVYGLGSFLCMLANYIWILLFPNIFAQKTWTLGKEILILTYELSTVAVVVATMSGYLIRPPYEPISYPKAWLIVASEGILPYLIAIFIKHIYLLRRRLEETKTINTHIAEKQAQPLGNTVHSVPLRGISQPIPLDDFLFAESRGNYLHLTVKRNGQITEEIVRMTIKEFLKANSHDQGRLFRCHRAFIVHLDNILQVEGNAAGYELTMHPMSPKVPVSRSRIEAFKSAMQQ